jgi:hypothetical protein
MPRTTDCLGDFSEINLFSARHWGIFHRDGPEAGSMSEIAMFQYYVTMIETPNGISNSVNISSEVCGTSIPAVSQFER